MLWGPRPCDDVSPCALPGLWFANLAAEANTLRAIHSAGGHENIAAVLDVFEDRDYYFFVLELVRLVWLVGAFVTARPFGMPSSIPMGEFVRVCGGTKTN